MELSDVINKFPDELREPILALVEVIRKEDIRLLREDMERGFRELREAIHELTLAQKKSEERLARLEEAVEGLTQAQKKSEERLTRLEKTVEELAMAQKRTEERVEELTQAQKKSEERLTRLEKAVEGLAMAQKRTEERVEELTQAQKETEENLNKLIKEHIKTREKVENLSHNFGFLLEDRAIQSLPEILEERGIKVLSRLRTKRMIYEGKEYELNIYGIVEEGGKKKVLVGECKSRMSKKEVNRFTKVIDRVKDRLMEEERADGVYLMVVVHRLNMEMEKYLKEKGIDFVESYMLRI